MQDPEERKEAIRPEGYSLWASAFGTLRVLGVAALVLLSGSGAAQGAELRVAATFTVLADLVAEVGGERVTVESLTPVGAEVHEWELQPQDFRVLAEAEAVFYNGYNLEQWMRQVRATVAEEVPVVAVGEASEYTTQSIRTGDFQGDPDPHLWMDPRAAQAYVQVIRKVLSEQDPEGAAYYAERAEAYREALDELHEEVAETLEAVPEQRRFLVTSEAAFSYFAQAYGFEHNGVWGTNTEEEGSPRQIMRIIDRLREHNPGAVFWESTIASRYIRSVAEEADAEAIGPLYVDSLSDPEGPAADYPSLMRYNAATIAKALGED
ncbi:MAG: metal ABC transporter solute-binding protein, Zn/Mn family [Halorhodospira sp.]